jgi:hypothetical protein
MEQSISIDDLCNLVVTAVIYNGSNTNRQKIYNYIMGLIEDDKSKLPECVKRQDNDPKKSSPHSTVCEWLTFIREFVASMTVEGSYVTYNTERYREFRKILLQHIHEDFYLLFFNFGDSGTLCLYTRTEFDNLCPPEKFNNLLKIKDNRIKDNMIFKTKDPHYHATGGILHISSVGKQPNRLPRQSSSRNYSDSRRVNGLCYFLEENVNLVPIDYDRIEYYESIYNETKPAFTKNWV